MVRRSFARTWKGPTARDANLFDVFPPSPSGTELRVDPPYALIEVALVMGLRPMQALIGLLNGRAQGLEELGALVSPFGRGCLTVGSSNREFRRWSTEHELEWRGARGVMYVGVLCVRKRSYVQIPFVLMLAYVVAKHCGDRLVVLLDFSVRLRMIRRRK